MGGEPRASCDQEESGSGWRMEGQRGRVGHFEQRSRNHHVFVSSTTTVTGLVTLLIQSTYCTLKKKQGFKSESQTPHDTCMQLPKKRLHTKYRSGGSFGIRNTLSRHISTLHSRLITNNMEFLCFWRNKLYFYQNIVGAKSVHQSELTDSAVHWKLRPGSCTVCATGEKLFGLQTSLLTLCLICRNGNVGFWDKEVWIRGL